MAAFPHGRQVFLFLVAVLFPSAVLVVLGLRIIGQERELAETRLADDRRRLVAELRQALTTQLDAITFDQLRSRLTSGVGPAARTVRHRAVRLVAAITEGRVVLPWEADQRMQRARASLSQPTFARMIAHGERAELAEQDLDRAMGFYREAVRTGSDPLQVAYGRLLLARVLMRARRANEAAQLYQKLLQTPSDLVDEHGIPLALYAATPLLETGPARRLVRRRLMAETDSAVWHTPAAAHMLLALLHSTDGSVDDTAATRTSAEQVARLNAEIVVLERGAALQQAFPTLGLRYGREVSRSGSPSWALFADGQWLVSVASIPGSSSEWLIAVEAGPILAAVRGSDRLSTTNAGLVFHAGGDAPGEALGPSFPGLKVAFTEAPEQTLAKAVGLQRSLSFAGLTLVLGIALFGAYLLWRDVRREVRLAELRSHFVSSVSHELKTPLTAIRMFAETLRARPEGDAAVQADYLDTIVGESERLTRLLNNVLDHSMIERDQKIYRREQTSLATVVRRAASAMEYPLTQGGFRLHLDTESETPSISADPDAVEQAILNLLTNAMKYSGDSRDIDLRLWTEDGHAVIEVKDRGVGIPENEQGRLTEKFYRVRSPDNDRIPGTGLGLTLVDHMARAHHGRLELTSEVGKGSTFAIHLPLDPTA